MRDIRTVNMSEGQCAESREVFKRIGDVSYRNMGVFSKLLFDEGKFLRIDGIDVNPSLNMVVSVSAGIGIQRSYPGLENFPFRSVEDILVTVPDATGSPRVDIIEARVKSAANKQDTALSVIDPVTGVISMETVQRDIKYELEVRARASDTTPSPATAAVLTGTIAIPGTIDLSVYYLMNVAIGEDGEFQEIDLRGFNPASTTRAEIISAINTAVGFTFAGTGAGNVVELTGDDLGLTSYFKLRPPTSDATKDALLEVFGLSVGGAYVYYYQGANDWFKIAEVDVDSASTEVTAGMIRDINQKNTWASEEGETLSRKEIYKELNWTPSINYTEEDKVYYYDVEYVCLESHISGANFYADLEGEYWMPTAVARIPYQDESGDKAGRKILKLINQSVAAGNLFQNNTIVSTFSLIYTTTGAYQGGVLAANGDVIMIPYRAPVGQKISAAGVVSTFSLVYTVTGAYQGGVLAANGDIIFIPYSANRGQKISAAGVVSTFSLIYTTAFGAYSGGVLAANGDVIMIPYRAPVGQKISVAGVVSTFSLIYTNGTGAYQGGVLAANGDIIFIPYNAAVGQKISAGGVVSTFSLIYTTTSAYIGGVLASNGDIIFIPYNANRGQKISAAGVVSTFSLVYTTSGAYYGGVLAANGDVIFIPYNAPVGQKISAAGVVSTFSLVYTVTGAYQGGILAANGDVIFIPYSANRGQKISTLCQEPFSLALCCSPYLNKF